MTNRNGAGQLGGRCQARESRRRRGPGGEQNRKSPLDGKFVPERSKFSVSNRLLMAMEFFEGIRCYTGVFR